MPLPPAPSAPQVEPLGHQPRLLRKSDLVHQGTFRVPVGSVAATLNFGGTGLCYWPAHDSLLLVGNDQVQQSAEISIALLGNGPLATLPRAVWRQPLTDILQGKRSTVDGGISNGVKVGGHLVVGNEIIVSAWTYYDGMSCNPGCPQRKTHFVTGQTFSTLTPASVSGPYQIGKGFVDYVPPTTPQNDLNIRIGGFVFNYMTDIPAAWQAALGGTHLTGGGGKISILNRTSSGPSASAFTPGVWTPTAPVLMGYPSNAGNPASPLHHPTLGAWEVGGGLGLYDGSQGFRGMAFPEGTRSILFFGWGGTHPPPNYGLGTTNLALDGQPVPTAPGRFYRYDPIPGNQTMGMHGYPYRSLVYAYDVLDFIAVRQGQKKPWEVAPYDTWVIDLPYQAKIVSGADVGDYTLAGAAWDPSGRRLFLTAYKCDGTAPIVHVLTVG
jgi:hypothetical protein